MPMLSGEAQRKPNNDRVEKTKTLNGENMVIHRLARRNRDSLAGYSMAIVEGEK